MGRLTVSTGPLFNSSMAMYLQLPEGKWSVVEIGHLRFSLGGKLNETDEIMENQRTKWAIFHGYLRLPQGMSINIPVLSHDHPFKTPLNYSKPMKNHIKPYDYQGKWPVRSVSQDWTCSIFIHRHVRLSHGIFFVTLGRCWTPPVSSWTKMGRMKLDAVSLTVSQTLAMWSTWAWFWGYT